MDLGGCTWHGNVTDMSFPCLLCRKTFSSCEYFLITTRFPPQSFFFSHRLSSDYNTDWTILKTKLKSVNLLSFIHSSVNSRNTDQHSKWSSKQNCSHFPITLILDRLARIFSDTFMCLWFLLYSLKTRATACLMSLFSVTVVLKVLATGQHILD